MPSHESTERERAETGGGRTSQLSVTMCRLFSPESCDALQGLEGGSELGKPLFGGGRVGRCQAERRVREGEGRGGRSERSDGRNSGKV